MKIQTVDSMRFAHGVYKRIAPSLNLNWCKMSASSSNEVCTICSGKIEVAGVFDCCSHTNWCYTCAYQWLTATSNTCPMCRAVVRKLAREPRRATTCHGRSVNWNRAEDIAEPVKHAHPIEILANIFHAQNVFSFHMPGMQIAGSHILPDEIIAHIGNALEHALGSDSHHIVDVQVYNN